MKKVIGFLITLLILATIGVFVFGIFAGKIIRTGIVKLGPEVAQVKIELEEAHISFLSGSGNLEGLMVHNPEGFSGNYAFYADNLSMRMQPMSVLSDKIIIEEILIVGPDIQFEQNLGSNNLKQLLDNVHEFIGTRGATAGSSKEGKKLEIRRFVFQNTKVGVGVGTKPVSLTIPTIELTDLGTGEKGITAGEVIGVVLTKVTNEVLAAIGRDPDVILKGGGDLLKNAGTSGTNALNRIGDFLGGRSRQEEKEEGN